MDISCTREDTVEDQYVMRIEGEARRRERSRTIRCIAASPLETLDSICTQTDIRLGK